MEESRPTYKGVLLWLWELSLVSQVLHDSCRELMTHNSRHELMTHVTNSFHKLVSRTHVMTSCHELMIYVTNSWFMSQTQDSCHELINHVTNSWLMSRTHDSCHELMTHCSYLCHRCLPPAERARGRDSVIEYDLCHKIMTHDSCRELRTHVTNSWLISHTYDTGASYGARERKRQRNRAGAGVFSRGSCNDWSLHILGRGKHCSPSCRELVTNDSCLQNKQEASPRLLKGNNTYLISRHTPPPYTCSLWLISKGKQAYLTVPTHRHTHTHTHTHTSWLI